MTHEELKDHLEQVHAVDVTAIGIPLEEAHSIDHDEWMSDEHEHDEEA